MEFLKEIWKKMIFQKNMRKNSIREIKNKFAILFVSNFIEMLVNKLFSSIFLIILIAFSFLLSHCSFFLKREYLIKRQYKKYRKSQKKSIIIVVL